MRADEAVALTGFCMGEQMRVTLPLNAMSVYQWFTFSPLQLGAQSQMSELGCWTDTELDDHSIVTMRF